MQSHPQHPDDERLAAFADADPEVAGDIALRAHVNACDRCGGAVADLTTLRAALAELPDVAPPRPLRLLPPAAERERDASLADRLAAFVRSAFAPAMAAGAGLALIGAIGTVGSAGVLDNAASGGAPGAGEPAIMAAPSLGAEAPADGGEGFVLEEGGDDRTAESLQDDSATTGGDDTAQQTEETRVAVERSPWPMVLFTGVALLVAVLLLRWILQPRAG